VNNTFTATKTQMRMTAAPAVIADVVATTHRYWSRTQGSSSHEGGAAIGAALSISLKVSFGAAARHKRW